jgi:hypothetical protein
VQGVEKAGPRLEWTACNGLTEPGSCTSIIADQDGGARGFTPADVAFCPVLIGRVLLVVYEHASRQIYVVSAASSPTALSYLDTW